MQGWGEWGQPSPRYLQPMLGWETTLCRAWSSTMAHCRDGALISKAFIWWAPLSSSPQQVEETPQVRKFQHHSIEIHIWKSLLKYFTLHSWFCQEQTLPAKHHLTKVTSICCWYPPAAPMSYAARSRDSNMGTSTSNNGPRANQGSQQWSRFSVSYLNA